MHLSAPILCTTAKIGYASRGIIYLIVGTLALLAALGPGGEKTDSRGALQEVLYAPGGWILVGLIAIGLLGYCAWRGVQSVLDADDHGSSAKAVFVRAGLLISAVSHFLLAVWAANAVYRLIAHETVKSSDGSGSESLSARVMAQPYGHWLLIAVSLGIISAGVAHAVKASSQEYEKWLEWTPRTARLLSPICAFGLYARSVVFFIIGIFIFYAGWTHDADEAGGLADALHWIQNQPYGSILLVGVSVGLVAFGAYSLIQAHYRRISPPSESA